MTDESQRPRRRRRKRIRSHKKLRLFLFSLGVTGFLLGIVLLGGRILRGNSQWGRLGLVYLLVSCVVLTADCAIRRIDKQRKRGYSKW
jgi:hypothetical protein